MTNSLLTTLLNMKQLNKIRINSLPLRRITDGYRCWIICFFPHPTCFMLGYAGRSHPIRTHANKNQRYTGTLLTIRRLRKIMTFAGIGFILAGLFMVEDSYFFLRPFVANSISGYSTYINIIHHNWVILLLISAVLEMYTTHRINYELRKERPT